MIQGIGVDILHLARLRTLLARQATRTGVAHHHHQPTSNKTAPAAQHFARRILCEDERKEWAKWEGERTSEELLWFLAVRWTSKEAAYKALFPSLPSGTLTWHDLNLSKRAGPKPTLDFSDEFHRRFDFMPRGNNHAQRGTSKAAPLPTLHLSVAHDGDYVVANVVAEC